MPVRVSLAMATFLLAFTALFVAIRPSVPAPVAQPLPLAPLTAPATIANATPIPPIPPMLDGYRVRVPRLGIDLPIAEGVIDRDIDQQKTPEGAAFHLPGTAIPGNGSNAYLYAHARVGMFLSLWNARVGDAVEILTPAGTLLQYFVSEVHPRVPPADVSWVSPTAKERLTLQTSTGPNPGDPRFVVVALPAD